MPHRSWLHGYGVDDIAAALADPDKVVGDHVLQAVDELGKLLLRAGPLSAGLV